LKIASSLLQTLSTNKKLGSDIPAQVLGILIANGEGVPSVASTYFRTIDVWLPIIAPNECTKRLETISADQNIELACLLLCMYLIIQAPSTGDCGSEMQSSTYFQAKTLHTTLIAAGKNSLEIIQAGVLVSLYEQGHGMIEAAQLTIAVCIRMATKAKIALRSKAGMQNTEFGRLWWGILILDR
jgi:hypothetical protein